MIRYKCVKCKQILESSEGRQGEFVKCPSCGVSNQVPPPDSGGCKCVKWIVLGVIVIAIVIAIVLSM